MRLANTGYQYPAEYSLPATKKLRLEDGSDLLKEHPELAYPDTDQQYPANAPSSLPQNTTSGTVLPPGVSEGPTPKPQHQD